MQPLLSMQYFMIFVFIIGYLCIIVERYIKINKTAVALLMAAMTWLLLFIEKNYGRDFNVTLLNEHLGNASQLIFFLLGAMTLVELIDSHKGFRIITDSIRTRSKRKILWITGFVSFFLSAILDNLTTTIVMVSVIRKLVPNNKERMLLGAAVIIAANAGGAWTPIGDVTTTMLWIQGQVTTLAVVKSLFLPSFFSVIVTFSLLSMQLKGSFSMGLDHIKKTAPEPGARIIFFSGVGALIFVPLFRSFTGLPPFMGMLVGLAILWIITDIMHHKYENRMHLRIPHILTKVDTSGIMFFLGIMLCINSLEIAGILKNLSVWIGYHVQNWAVISVIIGFLSAIVDNVPLVAACIGMYDLASYPPDSSIWQMIAYSAGVGGSILIIGSAAGVALMGLEKIDFLWYVKKITLVAITGYLAGFVLYLFLQMF